MVLSHEYFCTFFLYEYTSLQFFFLYENLSLSLMNTFASSDVRCPFYLALKMRRPPSVPPPSLTISKEVSATQGSGLALAVAVVVIGVPAQ
jgi:hypothetical protein